MDPLSSAESAASSLLRKLGSILVEEVGLLAGVENDVQYIMDELQSMTGFLRALSERQDHDLQVKIWMNQVRELAYDAEDTIDVFTHRLRRPHGERGLVATLSQTVGQLRMLKVRHGVASDLKNLRLRAHDVSTRRARYDLTTAAATSGGGPNYSSASTVNSAAHKARLSPPSSDEVKPVGIDDRRDEIVRWLDDEQPGLRVISIVGLGGLGKTTLAMMVFESSKDASPSFEARAWIAVSQSFEIKTLLQNMAPQLFTDEEIVSNLHLDRATEHKRMELERLMKNHLDKMEEMDLVRTIKNHLEEKRYVIVLDDIWSASAWKSIEIAFPPNNKKGSRIIVTTRNDQVAEDCSSRNRQFIYKIPPLDDNASWELFRKRAFDAQDNYSCPAFLENVSRNILKRCGGLPLAIVTIARVLLRKPKEKVDEWQKFLDCMSSELETNLSLEGIRQILTLSYRDLPYYLKPCLLSLSTFPEDYEISRTRLAKRWMVEGLVNPRRGKSDMEVAEEYFYELIDRNLILPSYIDRKGKVKYFRVHDVMLELIVSLSMDENFTTILNDHIKVIRAHGKIRRISFHERSSNPPHDLNLSQARSVTVVMSSKMPRLDHGKMRLLRVLDMEGCKGLIDRHHLKNISKLFLLKFLSLRNTPIEVLPCSIGSLQNLQYLDIRGCGQVKIPNSIVRLQRLAHFLFDELWKLPKGIENMKALQKCGVIDVSSVCSREIRKIDELTQLENFDVFFKVPGTRHWLCKYLSRKCQQVSSIERKSLLIFTSLGELHRCSPRLLTMIDCSDKVFDCLFNIPPPSLHFKEIILSGRMRSLPSWFAKLDLARIDLHNNRNFEQDITQVLKSLPALVILAVHSVSNEWCFDAQGFECLRKLLIGGAKKVIFQEGALSKLELLVFNEVANISGVEHLIKLNEICLYDIAKEEIAELNGIAERTNPNHPMVVVVVDSPSAGFQRLHRFK